jgi:hypothetical protein
MFHIDLAMFLAAFSAFILSSIGKSFIKVLVASACSTSASR